MTEFQEDKDYEDKDTMPEISLDSETYEEVIERIARNYLDTQSDNFLKKLGANQEQHLKDIEAQFTNRLKQQKQYFEDEITEINEAYKTKIETLSNTVNKFNCEISNLKGPLKIQTKQQNDMKDTIATQSETSDHDGYEPIPLDLDTPLMNRTQIVEGNEAINHHIHHDSNQHAREVTVGNTAPVMSLHALNSQNPKTHVPASTDFSANQNHNLPKKDDSAQGPILIISDSMPRGIKEMKLSSKIFIRKECFPGGTIKDINSYIQEFDGTTPCTKIVIHVGINDVFKSSEAEIIEGIKNLINILKDKWPNALHIFSGIILLKTNSRKNLIINRINQEIKLLSTTMNFTYLDNTNVVTLSSGLIGEETYLSNNKGIRKLANNLKIILNLKSRSQTRIGQPRHVSLPQQQYIKHDYKLNQESRGPSYAEAVKYHPQPAFQQQHNQFFLRDHVAQDANFIQKKHENSYPVLTTGTLITAMKPIADLFNQFNQLNVLGSLL